MNNRKQLTSRNGASVVWYSRADLEAGTNLPANQVRHALWDLRRAETRGFAGCWAVFIDARYDGLDEAVSEASRIKGSGWGRGQYVTYRNTADATGKLEPDRTYPAAPPEWSGKCNGFHCYVVINTSGARCGYVTVPIEHPWHGMGYHQCPAGCGKSYCGHSPGAVVRVHGGLTYASAEGDGGWTFGFDCSHAGDSGSPEYEHGAGYYAGGEYRSLKYVIAEIEAVAEQLAAVCDVEVVT